MVYNCRLFVGPKISKGTAQQNQNAPNHDALRYSLDPIILKVELNSHMRNLKEAEKISSDIASSRPNHTEALNRVCP
jgi:hypothetical protein